MDAAMQPALVGDAVRDRSGKLGQRIMGERKYSVPEIDRMRASLDKRWRAHHCGILQRGEWHREVEDELRTYMLNGTDPEELEAAVHQQMVELVAARRAGLHPRYPKAFRAEGDAPFTGPT